MHHPGGTMRRWRDGSRPSSTHSPVTIAFRRRLTVLGASGALLVGLVSAGLASSSPAGASTSSTVACGDVYGPEGLVDAINDANSTSGGTITLAQRCTYT